MRKKIIAAVPAACVMLAGTACGSAPQSSEVSEAARPSDDTPFAEYLSNTWIATGNNTVVHAPETVSYRAYLPVEQAGEFAYRFYFSNTVDSTWDDGAKSYVGMQGSDYVIESAELGTASEAEGAVSGSTKVTFDGAETRSVTAGETFWSDPVTFSVPEGQYLVWTWRVTGETLPAIGMSGLAPTYYSDDGVKYIYANEAPLPQLIGCKRAVTKKIAMIGDSITQGCGTSQYGNAFWVAEIAKAQAGKNSVWNLGLGYARASDCVTNGDWLQRATHADLVLVAFGTNDMLGGQYGVGLPNAAPSIDTWLRKIVGILQEAGCEVILLNAPPFDFDELHEGIRTELNTLLPATAEALGVPLFDWASLLSDPETPAKSLYGGHPDDAGCKIVAEQFLTQFADMCG